MVQVESFNIAPRRGNYSLILSLTVRTVRRVVLSLIRGATIRLFLMEDQGTFGISGGYHCPISLSVRGNAIPVSMVLLYCEMGPRSLPQTDAS